MEPVYPDLGLKYVNFYPSIRLHVFADNDRITIDHTVYFGGNRGNKLNLLEIVSKYIDQAAFAAKLNEAEIKTLIHKVSYNSYDPDHITDDIITLKWSYILKNLHILKNVINTIAKAMVVPAIIDAHLKLPVVAYTICSLQYAKDNGTTIFGIPSKPYLFEKDEYGRLSASPKKKKALAFSDENGNNVLTFPVNGNNVFYMKSKLTLEKIRQKAKADAFAEIHLTHVFDNLFFLTEHNAFVMVGLAGTSIVSFEFYFKTTWIPAIAYFLLENTMELMKTNKKKNDVVLEDYFDALKKKYPDIVLLYTKQKTKK